MAASILSKRWTVPSVVAVERPALPGFQLHSRTPVCPYGATGVSVQVSASYAVWEMVRLNPLYVLPLVGVVVQLKPSYIVWSPNFTPPQEPPQPLPIQSLASNPFVAVTLVTAEEMVMAPLLPLLPDPMPAQWCPPVAITVPPVILILPQLVVSE